MSDNSGEQDGINFQAFTVERIDEQFDEIKNSIKPDWSHKKIMKELHRILVNRMMVTNIYDKDSQHVLLYRVTVEYDGFDPTAAKSYSYPPNPKMGRANLKGSPVLYTSIDPVSAIAEMKGAIKEGEWFHISKWELNFYNDLYAHTLVLNPATSEDGHFLSPLTRTLNQQIRGMVSKIPLKFQDGFLYAVQKMGELYATPNKSMYHITSAYSHSILYTLREQNFDMPLIVYPAVENDQSSVNYAMHPSLADSSMMQLKEVYQVALKENKLKEEGHLKLSINRRGIFGEGKFVKWQAVFFEIVSIDYENIEIATYNKTKFKGEEANVLRINNTDTTVKDWVDGSIYGDEFQRLIADQPMYEEAENPLNSDVKVYEYGLILELNHGNQVETEEGMSCIWRVLIPVKWKKEYQDIEEKD